MYSQATKCNTTVKSGGNVEIHENAQITFHGELNNEGAVQTQKNSNTKLKENLTNNGNFTVDTNNTGGDVTFENPSKTLSINGSNTPEFYNLVVNVSNGLENTVPVDVINSLSYIEGIVSTPRSTPDFPINLRNDAIYTGAVDTKHTDGYSSYEGVLEHTFPVGDDNRLRTISVNAGASVTTSKAAYFYENPNSTNAFPLSFDNNERNEGISNISTFELWDLDGETPAQATLTWDILSNISQILDGESLDKLTIVGWSKSENKWVNLGNTSFSGDTNIGEITSGAFIPNDYEAITFARLLDEESADDGIEVFNGLSIADEDGKNDYLIIKNISKFPDNRFKIFNRWGVKVYEATGYDADLKEVVSEPKKFFNGSSNGRITVRKKDFLPVGTYFYILEYVSDKFGGEKSKSGYLYINR